MSNVFKTPPPNVKTELVQEFLYANFDIIASIEKLSSDRDLNLKVSTDDKSFVMKIANSSEDKIVASSSPFTFTNTMLFFFMV